MYCIGFNAYAHDPLSVHKMGFEWLYLVNNATGFDLAVDGSLVAENATTLHAAKTMTLQNVSCRGRGKDLSCSNNNLIDCIKTSLCSLPQRKILFQGGGIDLPGFFSVAAPSGKAPTKIKLRMQVNGGGKGKMLELTKVGSN